MKKILFTAVAATAVIFTACSSLNQNTSEKNEEKSVVKTVAVQEQELSKLGTEYATDVITGLEKGDYKRFIKNYASEYTREMNAAKFAQMAKAFQKRNGKLEKLTYLGTLNQGVFKGIVFKAQFARSKALEDELKRKGIDSAKTPVQEVLVRLIIGNVEGKWKIFAIYMN